MPHSTVPAICIKTYQKLFKLYQNISEEGYWESDIESILTVNVEVHTIKEIALSDKRIGSLTHQTLANMVHFGSKTEDAHCGVSIAWSLKKIIKKELLIKIDCIITIFDYPENCIFSILAIFGQFLDYSCQYGPFWVENWGCSTVVFPSLEAFFTRSKLNESAFYYILTSLGYLDCLCCTTVHSYASPAREFQPCKHLSTNQMKALEF